MAITSGPAKPRTGTREGLIRAGSVAWALVGIIVLAVFALWMLYQIRQIFPPLVLALLLIFLLNPLITWLEGGSRIPRSVSTVGIYFVVLAAVILAGALLAPVLSSQFGDLRSRWPEIQQNLTGWVESMAGRLGVSLSEVTTTLDEVQKEFFSGLGQITQFAVGAFHLVLIFVLAPFIALYLLIDLPRLRTSFIAHLPPQYREEWLMLLQKCGQAVGGFFRGQLMVALIVGVMSSVLLWVIGVPFWLPLGLLIGFFNIIPLVGPLLGGGVAVVVAAVDGGMGRAAWTALAMVGVQQIDNHFISPNVMSRSVRLHPVTIILALVAGGAIAGFWGMLLAVPATAVGKILILHYYTTNILGIEADEDEETPEGDTGLLPVADPPPHSDGPGPVIARDQSNLEKEPSPTGGAAGPP